MMMNFKKSIRISFLICTLSFLIITCKKNNIDEPVTEQPGEEQVDLSAKVTASVSGFVTNESDAAINGANVQYGASTTTTNKYGYFEIKNATVTEKAAFVTVRMPGYFKGIKTFIAEAGKENFCRIKLIPKTNSGTINATNGGDVTLTNGLSISFPANGIMDAVTKTAYTGTVNVSSFWIDPTSNDLDKLMPGDLRGINENNSLKALTTFGMAAVELTGSSGELLQVAEGKKASITMPIPAAISANAPATIPLWYFDETIGLWREEGSATKTGNVYVGDVKHFSFWNCDAPYMYPSFNCTIVDNNNNPFRGVTVKISEVDNPANCRYGYTNNDGYISGYIPGNAQLVLDVMESNCSIFSQSFTSGGSTVSLGIVKLPPGNNVMVSGTVTDCNLNPVSNGYIIICKWPENYFYPLSGGNFNIPVLLSCTNTIVSISAVNNATTEQSLASNYTLTDNIRLPNITTCGVNNDEYSNLTIDGESYILGPYPGGTFSSSGSWVYDNPPYTSFNITLLKLLNGVYVRNGDHIQWSVWHSQTPVSLNDQNYIRHFNIYRGADSSYTLLNMMPHDQTSNPVTINEYGNTGGYISGTFSGFLYKDISYPYVDTANPHYVTYNFRIKRY